ADHEDFAVGEVDQLQDAVDHRVTERDEGVDAAEHESVEDLLQQYVEVEQSPESPRRSPRPLFPVVIPASGAPPERIVACGQFALHRGCYRLATLPGHAPGLRSGGKKNAPDEPGQTSQGGKLRWLEEEAYCRGPVPGCGMYSTVSIAVGARRVPRIGGVPVRMNGKGRGVGSAENPA